MKAGIVMTGTGSILFLTSTDSFENPDFVRALESKGINRYIAFEVQDETVRRRYGQHYNVTMADMKQSDVLRIVDVDGQRIFRNLDLGSLSGPFFHEGAEPMRRAA